MTEAISHGSRVADIAARRPEETAIVLLDGADTVETMTWRALDERSNRAARAFARRGVERGSFVGISFPNSIEHYVAALGAWKLGACAMPVRPTVPDRERVALLAVRTPELMVGGWPAPCPVLGSREFDGALDAESPDPLPDVVSCPGRATTSGGTTGLPKLIVDRRPWSAVPHEYSASKVGRIGFGYGRRHLVVGALYHTVGFFFSHRGLFEEHTLFVMRRFDPGAALAAIERHGIQFTVAVPTMLRRMARHPAVTTADLSSVEAVLHTGGACPPDVKRFWIERLGPERVFESYGSTESAGSATCRGDEWLARPGTVGRGGPDCEIRILDEHGNACPPGTVGEIHFATAGPPAFHYLGGHEPRTAPDGSVSIGDLGHLDDDGYLFIADRRTDMIVSGGVNVYASEVEAALLEHPDVSDAVVIGLRDAEWGRRVHALLVPGERRPTDSQLVLHCRERLAAPKVPKTFEWLPELPRDDVGKIRRPALVVEREVGERTA
ncbi:putative acid-CoA ligase [Pseudonocardia sulfidoxydans NBRC 16205]|uniref:Putative acid-CoA ligase n=1 Tax=Pseudonocardia sulfidoxydans NBRC 16205 TaxID=1223511 RepID=A0A511DNZ1_9PSEU|nr:AMP-binding protein [Pseudonocardia sulfidoxydans]GEL26536.1 putative acid-CoA ligase [Pseudonocardia sulfidoxydans NBRC 16205]